MLRRLTPHLLVICSLIGMLPAAWAQPLQVGELSDEQHAGRYSEFLQEEDQLLQVEQAATLFEQGRGEPGESPILNFGIGSRPTWLHLQLHNPTDQPIRAKITSAVPWVDDVQLALLQSGKILEQWHAGDAIAGANDLVPGIGFVASMLIPTGDSHLYLRAASPDPLVLPIQVLDEETFSFRLMQYRFVYGLIYGFLLSMIVYNSMLFIGMRDRSYLYYSAYMGLFALLNFAYTGHGFAWVWPDNPALQNHSIQIGMVLFGCSGLAFTGSFLALADVAPRSVRVLQVLAGLSLAATAASLLLKFPAIAALIALTFSLIAPLGMVLLGLIILRQRRRIDGYYYLAATLCGMLGTSVTMLTIWGALPFTSWSYGAIKIGIILQATLLAIGLSYRIRQQQAAQLHAERISRRDPLTGLHNRRGFKDKTESIWSTAVRNNRPLSLIMLDLDHFKNINDLHGHALGDQALKLTARLLEKSCRGGDLIARWGGEEFLLLLPETAQVEAHALAERLRVELLSLTLDDKPNGLGLSASFGVIQRSAQNQLEQLINQADRLLYVAKQTGRNRVCAET